jgi:predicted Zn-dependent peptidase
MATVFTKPNYITLKNGLKIVHVPFAGIESANFVLKGRGGADFEQPEQYGLAHMLEHMAFRGTKKYPDSKQFKDLIGNLGGSINASTSYSNVSYKCKVLKKDLEAAFDHLSQQSIEPLLRSEDLEKEKGIVLEEINRMKENPKYEFFDLLAKKVYGTQRLSCDVIGTEATVNAITAENLADYHATYYGAENFVLSVCADVSSDEIFALGEKYFSSMPSGKAFAIPDYVYDTNEMVLSYKKDDAKQSLLLLEYPGYNYWDDRKYSKFILSDILGGGMSSRLFKTIREDHSLAYSVGSFTDANENYGTIGVSAGISDDNLEKVLDLIKVELRKIVERPVLVEEFTRAKNMLIADYAFGEENPASRASYYAKTFLKGLYDKTPEETLKKYEEVTIESVQKAAQELFALKPHVFLYTKSVDQDRLEKSWKQQ